jgi:hypothetical protein
LKCGRRRGKGLIFLLNLFVKFCQKYGSLLSFAKNVEICQVLPKIWNCAKVLPKIWRFVKNVEICQVLPTIWSCAKVLPKIWKFVKFCQKYGSLLSFAKNMEV